ncbi:30S ribosomal protein S17 [bacterium CG2_30_37_16]|nr:MAG: 30S ribosomal protein S17 [bacterium CG2_30_37_16]PIP30714.1 MAG: 30S ribosomal protein S17 [bacterium (Candidatus Howlettbacteria) CG23_combo_of_CG06-09_8_20_14_all_37_9]PIX99252.1 MAG: 30S ribosomal protein S17 [bacterium (Candidatus Howlettbacteria) CG_4_10_14_3_um_filter_37_10]PJB05569.1 MAG: 30S ribosomal protein S17 [bacterium (Candidatus Howlettbacteria) CG_4_9_14_3_um_filter_37_10]
MSRKLKGTVVSDKMDKTAVVRVDSLKTHPIYKKKFKVSKKYKIHDEENVLKIGDVAEFVETRPISKDKSWALSKVLEKV